MSKIPVVKRAFEVLAHMEKEHIDILRALLGRATVPLTVIARPAGLRRLDSDSPDHYPSP